MRTATKDAPNTSTAGWGMLPSRMRVLYVATPQRTGGWLAEAFASDSASEVILNEARGVAAGLAQVRDEVFDAVLLSHEPDELDALEFVEGLRAGGSQEPMIVLGNQSEQELTALCYEAGADAYVCVNTATVRSLIWILARAIEHHRLVRENQRLSQSERQRLQREHQEAQRLLDEQRTLVRDLAALRRAQANESGEGTSCGEAGGAGGDGALDLPEKLMAHYRELLRAYVIMGSGNLGSELAQLAELLVSAGISARRIMHLHLRALEELLHGLGSRSTRHVMTRADLLILEVIVHAAEGYRQLYQHRVDPPRQQLLPGFHPPA
jgi:DNA-binding response OmpR family regulator